MQVDLVLAEVVGAFATQATWRAKPRELSSPFGTLIVPCLATADFFERPRKLSSSRKVGNPYA